MEIKLTKSEANLTLVTALVDAALNAMPEVITEIRVIDLPNELRANNSDLIFETYIENDPEGAGMYQQMAYYSKPFMKSINYKY